MRIAVVATTYVPSARPVMRYSPRSSVVENAIAGVDAAGAPGGGGGPSGAADDDFEALDGLSTATRMFCAGSPNSSTTRPEIVAPRRRRISIGRPAIAGVASLRA